APHGGHQRAMARSACRGAGGQRAVLRVQGGGEQGGGGKRRGGIPHGSTGAVTSSAGSGAPLSDSRKATRSSTSRSDRRSGGMATSLVPATPDEPPPSR